MSWHDYLALFLFTAAAVFVATRAYRAFFAHANPGCSSGCGSCGGTTSAATSHKLVTIERLSAETPRH